MKGNMKRNSVYTDRFSLRRKRMSFRLSVVLYPAFILGEKAVHFTKSAVYFAGKVHC